MDSDRSRVKHYRILKTLGKGCTSKVKLALNTETGEHVAVKIIRPEKFSALNIELSVLRRIPEHPNIIKLLDYSMSSTYFSKSGKTNEVSFLVLELGKNGEIFDYISKLGAFPEPIVRKCFLELLSAIEILHNSGVVHRDLKPENIFFNESFELKLADFGFCGPSAGRDGSGQLNSFKGTRPYMAPEILENKPYCGTSTDLFSLGIILFIFTFGRPPFIRAEKINPHYVNIFNKNWERFWRIHNLPNSPQISAPLKDLLERMLAYVPGERITIEQIKEHEWYRGVVATQEEATKFLEAGVKEDENETKSGSEGVKGYRGAFSEELILSRGNSRSLAGESLVLHTSKFIVDCGLEALSEGIQEFFKDKGEVKSSLLGYGIKVRTQEFEAAADISRVATGYLVEMSRVSGNHWRFYEVFRELKEAFI